MRAVMIEQYGVRPEVVEVDVPQSAADGAVLRVASTGLCRSDWHGWQGHDLDIRLPHVPGHEFAGVIEAVGPQVDGWSVGDRVTVPFVCACGGCEQCLTGNHQICTRQQQPGFSYWGSFAQFVAVPNAEVNLVRLPAELSFDAAAGLGCRFATAYRAVRQVGRVQPGDWLVVIGCGGVGLSAIMIAVALGARVIAVDVNPDALAVAAGLGTADEVLAGPDAERAIRRVTGGGAHVAIDALGSADAVRTALSSLRPGGRHVQVGLLPGQISLEMSLLIGRELQWLGSHGMAAHQYRGMLEQITAGSLRPGDLIARAISLDEVPDALVAMSGSSPVGVTIIHPW
jgi:alcohol dehydrogenase